MNIYDTLQLNSDFTEQEYAQPPAPAAITQNFGDTATVVTTINGNSGGGASGPSITISGGTTGLAFAANTGNVTLSGTLVVANGGTGATTAAGARTNLSAAKSGVNADITSFTALTGNTGWSAWTGGSDKTAHATFSGTASVGYVQAELQAVMDKLKEITEAYKALQDVLLGIGITEP